MSDREDLALKATFGQQLRFYRRRATDPLRGGLLTQERLGELLGQEMGDAGYSGAAVSDWERDKSKIHADDRRVLVALLAVLVQTGGLADVEEANGLLALGNYRRLNPDETRHVFPELVEKTALRDGQERPDAGLERRQEQRLSVNPSKRPRAEIVLLQKVRQFWVEGVFAKATADAPELDLTICAADEAVDHPWEGSLGPALIGEECRVGEAVLDLFTRADRALLILGAPGSGKTMTLIRLADGLLSIAEHDAQAPLPVILDVASWAKEKREFDDWAVEELAAKYQIPRRYGREWVAGDKLILLLDGFDVLPAQSRLPCIRAINRFRVTNGLIGLTICSRSQEYLATSSRLRLNRAVRIEPLDTMQIEEYIGAQSDSSLLQAVRDDEEVRQLARSPLMLHVLAAVSGVAPLDEEVQSLPAPGVPFQEAAYGRLFEAYTRQMFDRRPPSRFYSPQQTLHYLRWLARRLEENSESIFMIEALQPSWLPSKRWRRVYMLLSGSLLGIAGGVIMWLLWRLLRHTLPQLPAAVSIHLASLLHVASQPLELLTILAGNLVLGLLAAVTIGIFFERRWQTPVEADRIEQQRWIQVWTVGLVCGIVAMLFVAPFAGWLLAVAWGVAEGFMYWAATRFLFGWSYASDIRTVEALGWSWRRAWTGFALGVLLTLIAELLETALYGYNGFERTLVTLTLAGFILAGISGSRTSATSWPNQGVWLSLRNAWLAAVFVAIPLTIVTAMLRDLPYALILGVLLVLISVSLFGAGVFVKHFLLRVLLRAQGSVPWRYARFLDYAAQIVLLRKVGGGYIFMHRLLQQHLAKTLPNR